MLWVIVSTLLVLVVVDWLISAPFYWRKRGVRSELPFPLFGSVASAFVQPIYKIWKSKYDKWKDHPYHGFHFFRTPALFLSDPDMIKKVFVEGGDHFASHGFTMDQNVDIFGRSLFHVEGQQWKSLRTKISPFFTSAKVKAVTPVIEYCTERGINKIKSNADSGPIEVQSGVAMKIATDSLVASCFGLEANCFDEPDSFFPCLQREMLGPTAKVKALVNSLSPRFYRALGLTFFSKVTMGRIVTLVKEMVQLREKGEEVRQDFFQGMVELMRNEGKDGEETIGIYEDGTRKCVFDLEGVTAQCLIMFVGGTETTGCALGFALHELAHNQEIQEKLRKEIMTSKKSPNDGFTYEEVQEFTYLQMIVTETLRKYPVSPIMHRRCTNTYQLGDLTVEKGTFMLASIYGIHWDERYYPNPEKFIPERFAPGENNSGIYLPFGTGPRTCVGMKFALNEIKFAVAKIVSRFRLLPSEKTPYTIEFDRERPILTAKGGIWIEVETL